MITHTRIIQVAVYTVLMAHLAGSPCRSQPVSSPTLRTKCIPGDWQLQEIDSAMPAGDRKHLHVLAWEKISDRSSWERCLVARMYTKANPNEQKCVVGYLYRKPESLLLSNWSVFKLHTTPPPDSKGNGRLGTMEWAYQWFKTIPTDDDLEQFLDKWAWGRDLHNRQMVMMPSGNLKTIRPVLKDGGICNDAWKTAFGRSAPPRLFPELITPEKAPSR